MEQDIFFLILVTPKELLLFNTLLSVDTHGKVEGFFCLKMWCNTMLLRAFSKNLI